MSQDRRYRLWRASLGALLAVLPLLVAGCAEQGVCVNTSRPAGGDTSYFGDEQFVGQTVTLCSEVDRLLTHTSFVFDFPGGERVLVVSALETPDIDLGDELQVSGVVREFRYEAYAEEFELSEARLYAAFEGEQFLVAKSVNENYTPDPD